MGSGGVAIAALPTVICLKVPFSDGLGGAFSKVDLPYIKRIVSANENPDRIQWYVSTFTDIDKSKALSTLRTLGIDIDNIHFKPMSEFIRE